MRAVSKIWCFIITGVVLVLATVSISAIIAKQDSLAIVDMGGNTLDNDTAGISQDSGPVLHIAIGAIISPEITKKYYDDLLRLIADKLGRRAVFSQKKTYSEINTLLEQKKIDVAFICAGPYVSEHEKFGSGSIKCE